MRFVKFTVCQGGKLLGTCPIMEQAVEAAKGYAVSTGAPVHVTGYRDDGAGGGSYLCKRSRGSESARMVNVKSGWDFIAHGLRRYFDGSIEWDYSTGGCFGEVPV